MTTSDQGIALIHSFARCRMRPYEDPLGYDVIGWSHKLPYRSKHKRITRTVADELFAADLSLAEMVVNWHVHVPLTQPQFDALVSFVFDIGAKAFTASGLLSKLNAGAVPDVIANEFLRWMRVPHRDRVSKSSGLLLRRTREHDLYLQET